MIQEIELSKLKNHPMNVRRTYADIDELADSIKKNGVMQNLTVIPDPDQEGCYLVVIGNRRLLAAQKAGLQTVPCQIADMDQKTVAETMLLENMQRNDLSIIDQAYGFQLCLDLGDTAADIAEKTGLSKQTVKHRIEIARLDEDSLERRYNDPNFQLTMQDLIALEKNKECGQAKRDPEQCIFFCGDETPGRKRGQRSEQAGSRGQDPAGTEFEYKTGAEETDRSGIYGQS